MFAQSHTGPTCKTLRTMIPHNEPIVICRMLPKGSRDEIQERLPVCHVRLFSVLDVPRVNELPAVDYKLFASREVRKIDHGAPVTFPARQYRQGSTDISARTEQRDGSPPRATDSRISISAVNHPNQLDVVVARLNHLIGVA